MLSLDELPPPPILDRSYSQKELAKRESKSEEHRAGWVVVGGAGAVAQVPADEDSPDTSLDRDRSALGDHSNSPYDREVGQELSRHSTPQSLSTLSRSSTSSGHIQVTSSPEYEPIAVGDEDAPGSTGQQDRNDGKVDSVFKLHSSRRMKPSSTGRGVSIASRRSNTSVPADVQKDDGYDTSTSCSLTKLPRPTFRANKTAYAWCRLRCSSPLQRAGKNLSPRW